jgi:hypothetical protein
MAWEDNRNKSPRDISKEERLAWLRKQIAEMEMAVGKLPPMPASIKQRITPRIRRNGKWLDEVE